MGVLDGIDLASADPGGMLDVVLSSPDQWADALRLALDAGDPPVSSPRAVLVAGMGGSGIAGDVAALAAARSAGTPVVPVKGYGLPAWADARDLLVAVSYSGNTEETLACLDQAEDRGLPVFAVTSGGQLAERLNGRTPLVLVPSGRQPRASLAYLSVPVLVALGRAGVLDPDESVLASIPETLRPLVAQWEPGAPASAPGALSDQLSELVPVFMGGSGLGELVAARAKCQVNENANRPAFASVLPEANHNEVVGWEQLQEVSARMALVEVRDPDDHPQVTRRFDVSAALTADVFGAYLTLPLVGDHWLHRLAAGVLFVDLVSVYLALTSGVDPTPVATIELLKERIA